MTTTCTFHVGPWDDSLERSSVQQIHDLLLRLCRKIITRYKHITFGKTKKNADLWEWAGVLSATVCRNLIHDGERHAHFFQALGELHVLDSDWLITTCPLPLLSIVNQLYEYLAIIHYLLSFSLKTIQLSLDWKIAPLIETVADATEILSFTRKFSNCKQKRIVLPISLNPWNTSVLRYEYCMIGSRLAW